MASSNQQQIKMRDVSNGGLALGGPISHESLLPSPSYQMCFSPYVGLKECFEIYHLNVLFTQKLL